MKSGIAVVLLLAATTVHAQKTDHPLITRYPGSTIERKEVKEYDEQLMLLGRIDKERKYKSEKVEGKITRMVFKDPKDRSTLEKFRNYESALKQAGFTILYSCTGSVDCVERNSNYTLPTIGAFPISDDSRNLTARLKRSGGDVWVGLQVLGWETKVQIAEVKPMDVGMVKVDADALGKGILSEGRVAVYGIYFDTGKADIKPESAETLKEIASMLAKQPKLKLHVVGHTDNTGTLASNLDLSKRRAAAVVKALTTTYKVAADRLRADGVGPLAPLARNVDDAGKAKNRRVELVEQ